MGYDNDGYTVLVDFASISYVPQYLAKTDIFSACDGRYSLSAAYAVLDACLYCNGMYVL